MAAFTLVELAIPASLDAPGADDFRDTVDVRNAVRTHDAGTADLEFTAEELLPGWLDPYEPKRLFVARVDGRIVARGIIERKADNAATAWLLAEVLPEYRGRGIGRALAVELERAAGAEGRSKAIVYAPSPAPVDDGAAASGGRGSIDVRVDAPTGFGSVPAANPEVRLLLDLGYSLEQVARGSRLQVPVDDADLVASIARARERADADEYRVHLWADRTPRRWREDLVHLLTRMSTDAPSAGLEEPEDRWTVERLLDDERSHAADPRMTLTAAVEHVPSGRLVGFTELNAPAEVERPVSQEDTLVLREHRGRRLGLLLKAENLRHLQRAKPGHASVTTYNAEENRHMLEVNEALGFRPFLYEGAWRKNLRPE